MSEPVTDEIQDVILNHQVVDSLYSQSGYRLWPVMGTLKDNDYTFSKERNVTKEMIEEMVDLDPNEAQIITQHFISPMSDDLAS